MKNEITFLEELTTLLNRHSRENESDTPDYVLVGFLLGALKALDAAIKLRDKHYGRPARDAVAQAFADGERHGLGDLETACVVFTELDRLNRELIEVRSDLAHRCACNLARADKGEEER